MKQYRGTLLQLSGFQRIAALLLHQADEYSMHCRMECQLRRCVTGGTAHIRWWMWGRKVQRSLEDWDRVS